jgi:hypothetical protein
MLALKVCPRTVPLAISTAKPVRKTSKTVKNAKTMTAMMHSTAHGQPGNYSPQALTARRTQKMTIKFANRIAVGIISRKTMIIL